MGNQIPTTRKQVDSGSNDAATWATACMQGWRSDMEDAHVSLPRLPAPPPADDDDEGVPAIPGAPLASSSSASSASSSSSDGGTLFCRSPLAFFGVFDGHGGAVVPRFVAEELPRELARELAPRARAAFVAAKRAEAAAGARARLFVRQKRASAEAAAAVRDDVAVPEFVARALRNAFVETDWRALDAIPSDAVASGTTAVAALVLAAERPKLVNAPLPPSFPLQKEEEEHGQDVQDDDEQDKEQEKQDDEEQQREDEKQQKHQKKHHFKKQHQKPDKQKHDKQQPPALAFNNSKRGGAWGLLWVANSGDSRAVLCRAGAAVAMSEDHKPGRADELRRIRAAGHSVAGGRVDGSINLSRSLGDWRFKSTGVRPERCAVSSVPDVRRRTLARDDEFLVLACDGVWDRMTSQQLCTFVRLRLLPRAHWGPADLAADQGLNPAPYDPYAELPELASLSSRSHGHKHGNAHEHSHEHKHEHRHKHGNHHRHDDKSGIGDSGETTEEGLISSPPPSPPLLEGDCDPDDIICGEYTEEGEEKEFRSAGAYADADDGEEEDDEDLEEKRRAFEERSEPRDEWERYRLWPGDPGVCESVEELLATVARHVCHNCLSADNGASLYGTDNMTVTIVLFRHSALGRAVRKRYLRARRARRATVAAASSTSSSALSAPAGATASTEGTAPAAAAAAADWESLSCQSDSSAASRSAEPDEGGGVTASGGCVPISVSASATATATSAISVSPVPVPVLPSQPASAASSPMSLGDTAAQRAALRRRLARHPRTRLRVHIDAGAPLTDAEKLVYTCADDFSGDECFAEMPPESPSSARKS